MKSPAKALLKRAGVDRAIAYTLMSRGWTVVAGPLNLWFVVSYLSKTEQGFYYTFASVLGLQIFFELGLGMVVLQFVSHEKALLQWTNDGRLEPRADAPEEGAHAKARLASLVRLTARWYGGVALGFALVVPLAGWAFFSRNHAGADVNWLAPWVFVSVLEAGNLLLSPYFAITEGCGLVSKTALVRLGQNVVSSFLFWFVLGQGGGLWGTGVAVAVALLSSGAWLVLTKRALFGDLWRTPENPRSSVDWKTEIWPLQWKIALSWLAGYFIFSLFNPVAFALLGAESAGRIGMSLAIASAIWTMAFSWLGTKAAPFGTFVAVRKWRALDDLFFPALWQSSVLVVLGSVAFWGAALWVHESGHRFASRILEPLPLALLLGATLVNHIIAALGLYLRAHKKEPFLVLSLLSGVLIGLSTIGLGYLFGATGMMAGYLAVSCAVGLGLGVPIFRRSRALWHQDEENGSEAEPLETAPREVAAL